MLTIAVALPGENGTTRREIRRGGLLISTKRHGSDRNDDRTVALWDQLVVGWARRRVRVLGGSRAKAGARLSIGQSRKIILKYRNTFIPRILFCFFCTGASTLPLIGSSGGASVRSCLDRHDLVSSRPRRPSAGVSVPACNIDKKTNLRQQCAVSTNPRIVYLGSILTNKKKRHDSYYFLS